MIFFQPDNNNFDGQIIDNDGFNADNPNSGEKL